MNQEMDSSEQRIRLSNRACKQMGPQAQAAYPTPKANHDIDMFAAQLWEVHTGRFIAEYNEGDPHYRPKYYVRPLVLEGGGTIIFAPGGSGKSFLAMTVACSIEYGDDTIWEDIHSRPTLYVNLERDPRLLRRRLAQVNRCLGAQATRPLRFLHARGRSLVDIKASIQRTVEKDDLGLVVVDSISRLGAGNLNDNEPANGIIDTLNSLCPTWFAVGHTSKANKNEVFGSTHFANGADITVRLTHAETNGLLGIRLKQIKTNDVGKAPDEWLAYEFNGDGLSAIRRSSRNEFPALADEDTPEERIDEYLVGQGSATVRSIALDTDLAEGIVRRFLSSGKDKYVRMAGTERAGVWALKYEGHPQ